jgi:dihydrolipoamide dehydrogenase
MPDSTQVAVIGAGPGGYAAAFLAADLGLEVTLIDPETNPGGVCLYRGCIPSKALLHVARVIAESRHAVEWGVRFGEPRIDVDRLRDWKNGVVERLTGGLGQLARQRKVDYVRGRAGFRDAGTIEIEPEGGGNSRTLSFEHAIIATGSRPAAVPGLAIESERVLDSSSALEVRDVPETLLVVGGGYIGLELGTVYAVLGTRVTVVEMTAGLLPGADRDLVGVLEKRAAQIFHSVRLDTRVTGMKEQKQGVRVTFEGKDGGKTDEVFEKVLVAVGRRPNSTLAGLDRAGVRITERGFILVDRHMRTDAARIFAIGDVVGEPMLAHKASHEGRVAAEVIAGGKAAFDPAAIPAVVFTDPEIAWCGLTETEARSRNRPVKIARFPWAASGRAMTLDGTGGVTKLVLDPASERVLGVGVAGSGAGELIAEGVLAVEMAALASDIAMSIHPHPTLSETLMEAAEVFFGHATHVYRPKRP